MLLVLRKLWKENEDANGSDFGDDFLERCLLLTHTLAFLCHLDLILFKNSWNGQNHTNFMAGTSLKFAQFLYSHTQRACNIPEKFQILPTFLLFRYSWYYSTYYCSVVCCTRAETLGSLSETLVDCILSSYRPPVSVAYFLTSLKKSTSHL